MINLGIKQPAIAYQCVNEHGADAIGMSGLLVKSTLVMKENLEVLNEQGIKTRCAGRRGPDAPLRGR